MDLSALVCQVHTYVNLLYVYKPIVINFNGYCTEVYVIFYYYESVFTFLFLLKSSYFFVRAGGAALRLYLKASPGNSELRRSSPIYKNSILEVVT